MDSHPSWGTGRPVLLLVTVGIPSISAPPTDWSADEALWKHHPRKAIQQPTNRSFLHNVEAPPAIYEAVLGLQELAVNTSVLARGAQHTGHLEGPSFCLPRQTSRPHQREHERVRRWPTESSHPKSFWVGRDPFTKPSELGLCPATVNPTSPCQVHDSPQPPVSTFPRAFLTLKPFFLASRNPSNTSSLCAPTNGQRFGHWRGIRFPFYATPDDSVVCIFVRFSEHPVAASSINGSHQDQRGPLRLPSYPPSRRVAAVRAVSGSPRKSLCHVTGSSSEHAAWVDLSSSICYWDSRLSSFAFSGSFSGGTDSHICDGLLSSQLSDQRVFLFKKISRLFWWLVWVLIKLKERERPLFLLVFSLHPSPCVWICIRSVYPRESYRPTGL